MSSVNKLLAKIVQGLLEYLMFFPVFLVIGINLIKTEQLWSWLFGLFLLFTVGLIVRSVFLRQQWWLFGLFATVIGISFTYIFIDHFLLLIIFSIFHLIIIYRGMMYVSRDFEALLPVPVLWGGILGVYLVSYFFFKYIEILQPYMRYVTGLGVGFLILTLFVSNHQHLKRTTLSKEKHPFISKTIKKQNRLFLSVTILIIVLLTNGRTIQELLGNGFKAIIKWLIERLSSGESKNIPEETPQQAPVDLVLPFVEEKERSAFMVFLEMIATYAAYVLAGIVLLMLLMLTIKKTRVWLMNVVQSLLRFLRNIVNQVVVEESSGHYEEEKESVFDWHLWKKSQQEKTKRFMNQIFKRKPNWEALSNQQKVKFVYQTYVEQEIAPDKYKVYETPREVLSHIKDRLETDEVLVSQLKTAYEQARYGEKDVDERMVMEIFRLINEQK